MSDNDLMTYSKLRKIQKEEKRENELVELNDKFLLSLSDYLETKKKHSDDEREFKNAKRVFEKIISLREDKITEKAKIAAKTNTPTNLNLLPEEEQLFRELKKQFSAHNQLLEEKINIETNQTPSETKKTETETEQKQQEQEHEERESQRTDNEETEELQEESVEEGFTKIEIQEEVPEFMGTDLETYGPFEEGDTATIPEENAEILINRGNAEEK